MTKGRKEKKKKKIRVTKKIELIRKNIREFSMKYFL